jgi:hypothetical protein
MSDWPECRSLSLVSRELDEACFWLKPKRNAPHPVRRHRPAARFKPRPGKHFQDVESGRGEKHGRLPNYQRECERR